MNELRRSWPVIGISAVMWLAVVILRTPALGIDAPRIISIVVSATAMFTLGVYIERIRRSRDQEKNK
ncbi:hypothetical protein KHO57_gp206 [Mycobacterium phage Phabba]|uniref:Uncharacterized protein n=1 Tax=Mycobacterium phage Phabba TaxID=2027899 RepID=A0A249XSK2_9CAUD|nr:hypothetical protein KHO57_gp206 [Mycobacterium phage Phabba]ASZ74698.1 hypothetical protein SEA_PHABBA_129 [Mycobacterium phage Phabba]